MRIISVALQDFRVHKDLTIEFDSGINLLIGENGAGKSSILEAIGLALFNSDLRVKGNNRNAIRQGAKTAGIQIAFVGNDENEYRVERKIGSVNRWQLFLGEEKSPRYQGSEQVIGKIRELSGMVKNERRLFTDVICAVQNHFVDIFNGTKQQREDSFNVLFDTDIYRDLYRNFTGDDSVDRFYKDQLLRLEEQVSGIEESRVDEKSAQEEYTRISGLMKSVAEEIAELDKKTVQLENESKELDLAIRKQGELEQELVHIGKEEVTNTGVLKENLLRTTQAKEAKAIVDQNRNAFDSYEVIQKEVAELDLQLRSEESARNSHADFTRRLSDILIEIEKGRGVIRSNETAVRTLDTAYSQLLQEGESCSGERVKLEGELGQIMVQGSEIKTSLDSYRVHLEKCRESEERAAKIVDRLGELEREIVQSDTLSAKVQTVNSEIVKLVQAEEVLKGLQDRVKEYEIQLRELRQAKSELHDGLCPLLREQCKNIGGATDVSPYFSAREKELEESLAQVKREMRQYEQIPPKLLELRSSASALEEKLRQISLKIEQKKVEEEKKRNEIAAQTLLLRELALVEPALQLTEYHQYQPRFDQLSEERMVLLTKHSAVKNQLQQLTEKQGELEKQKEQNRAEQNRLIQEKESALVSEQKLLEEHSRGESEQKSIQLQLEEFGRIRTQRDGKSAELVGHEKGYRLVLEHRESATSISDLEQGRALLEDRLLKLSARREEILLEQRGVDKAKMSEQHETVLSALKESREIRTVRREAQLEFQAEIKQLESQINLAREQKKRLETIGGERSRLKRKLELTNMFRLNLKDMGRFVASRVIENIAADASAYFHRITGRGERVEWLVNETEKYTVFLTGDEEGEEYRREFAVLSGGEQVAVALSLRAAMANELGTCKFAIFDEPTVNLDTERRAALAESLKAMLGEMPQTIIVTHDDAFREMAQKTIELT